MILEQVKVKRTIFRQKKKLAHSIINTHKVASGGERQYGLPALHLRVQRRIVQPGRLLCIP